MPSGKCVFNRAWTREYDWIRETVGCKHKAHCVYCCKDFEIGTMGESAVKSHAQSMKHKKNTGFPSLGLSQFGFKPVKTEIDQPSFCTLNSDTSHDTSLTIPPPPGPVGTGPPAAATGTFTKVAKPAILNTVSTTAVLKAEIMWTLRTVVTHSSYKSNEEIGQMFKVMFPDSDVARKFSCGERKSSYLCMFGIAEHFKKLIMSNIRGLFVLLFDESLNKKLQEKQMDIHVRYWDTAKHEVVTRYVGSQFLGHATAEEMKVSFMKEVGELKMEDLLQISMDGPNVNWKFHKLMDDDMKNDFGHSLINIGSCGLHTLHNSFKSGAEKSGWDVASILGSLYYLFKDSPARREDYEKIHQSNIVQMPLKFVNHRWLENVNVATRAIRVWPYIQLFVQKTEAKEINKPSNKSYSIVSEATKDKLILAKIQFFLAIAQIIQPFLTQYQTDKPMVPFLCVDLIVVIKALMRKVVKEDLIDRASTTEKLLKIDMDDKANLLSYKKIDIGLATEEKLTNAKPSEKEFLEFMMECRKFVLGVVKKMTEKSPVTYSLVRQMSCLCPQEMVANKHECREKFRKLLKLVIASNRITEAEGDVILNQFTDFLDSIPIIGTASFTGFDQIHDRLDTFFVGKMSDPKFSKLLEIVKLLLILSHGQATVERGFSVNKEIECENLKEQSVVAQRIICDFVKSVGGVMKVPITDQLLVSCSSARSKYEVHLTKQRAREKSEIQQRKRKSILEEIDSLKKRKTQTESDQSSLEKKADELSVKAEKTLKWQLLAEANALRKKAKEKIEESKELGKKLESKQSELKDI